MSITANTMHAKPRTRRIARTFTFISAIAAILAASAIAPSAAAQSKVDKVKNLVNPPHPDALDEYLKSARNSSVGSLPTTGSLWNGQGRFADIASDDKARRVGDLVTIQLAESTTSAQQGSVQTARTFSASSSLTAFFGATGSHTAVQNLFSPNSAQALNGKGQTALTTSLTTALSANVIEILPNGMMVIEAQRQVRATDQTETMTLRGIIRPDDLTPTNIVLSSQISHLEVKLEGNGVITEGTHPPNALVRILLRIVGF
jgi:flagellar L-ring protein precursor FlgH